MWQRLLFYKAPMRESSPYLKYSMFHVCFLVLTNKLFAEIWFITPLDFHKITYIIMYFCQIQIFILFQKLYVLEKTITWFGISIKNTFRETHSYSMMRKSFILLASESSTHFLSVQSAINFLPKKWALLVLTLTISTSITRFYHHNHSQLSQQIDSSHQHNWNIIVLAVAKKDSEMKQVSLAFNFIKNNG